MKRCGICQLDKPLTEFNKYSRSSDGRNAYCRRCVNEANRKSYERTMADGRYQLARERQRMVPKNKRSKASRRYQRWGATTADFDAVVLAAEGRCDICDKSLLGEQFGGHIDHDHQTGVLRGLLCRRCNTGLGMLGDNTEGLVRALEYLWKSSSVAV